MTEHLKNLYIDMLSRPIWNHIASVTKNKHNSYEIVIEPALFARYGTILRSAPLEVDTKWILE
jgi:hypothetical protein